MIAIPTPPTSTSPPPHPPSQIPTPTPTPHRHPHTYQINPIPATMSCVIEQYERFEDGELLSAYEKAYVRGSNILYFGLNKEVA